MYKFDSPDLSGISVALLSDCLWFFRIFFEPVQIFSVADLPTCLGFVVQFLNQFVYIYMYLLIEKCGGDVA